MFAHVGAFGGGTVVWSISVAFPGFWAEYMRRLCFWVAYSGLSGVRGSLAVVNATGGRSSVVDRFRDVRVRRSRAFGVHGTSQLSSVSSPARPGLRPAGGLCDSAPGCVRRRVITGGRAIAGTNEVFRREPACSVRRVHVKSPWMAAGELGGAVDQVAGPIRFIYVYATGRTTLKGERVDVCRPDRKSAAAAGRCMEGARRKPAR